MIGRQDHAESDALDVSGDVFGLSSRVGASIAHVTKPGRLTVSETRTSHSQL